MVFELRKINFFCIGVFVKCCELIDLDFEFFLILFAEFFIWFGDLSFQEGFCLAVNFFNGNLDTFCFTSDSERVELVTRWRIFSDTIHGYLQIKIAAQCSNGAEMHFSGMDQILIFLKELQ